MLASLYSTMQVFTKNKALQDFITNCKAANLSIGFVPTMGALHQGHISLITNALAHNDVVVCSIYVNPTQFNNQADLHNYPRTQEQDLALLEKAKCTAVYIPETADLYPDEVKSDDISFGDLENVMEGKYRPGHFKGMATVVKRLFLAIKPTRAYFGEKDYQQLAIIKLLVEREKLPIEIVGCPIVRELDGLALSSRNTRLNVQQRHAAPAIFRALNLLKSRAKIKSLNSSVAKAIENINAHPDLAVEYLYIVDEKTLQPIADWKDAEHAMAFAAVMAGEVRLIDNITLY